MNEDADFMLNVDPAFVEMQEWSWSSVMDYDDGRCPGAVRLALAASHPRVLPQIP